MDGSKVITGPATSFGWMRRGELENGFSWVWESPQGTLHHCQKGVIPELSVCKSDRKLWVHSPSSWRAI